MATNTANFNLRKPEGADLVNVLTDLGDNYEKIDDLGDAWTAFTPTWGSSTGTQPVLGNGTLTGRRKQIGKTTHFIIRLLAGSTTTFGSAVAWYFITPWNAVNAFDQYIGNVVMNDVSAGVNYRGILLASNNTNVLYPMSNLVSGSNIAIQFLGPAVPFAWANGDSMILTGTVETA